MIRILLSTRLGERRWSQADLARATGIRPSTINDLYHEIAERVNLEHLDLICEALGCELSDLMIREENKETRVKARTGASLQPQNSAAFARSLADQLPRFILFPIVCLLIPKLAAMSTCFLPQRTSSPFTLSDTDTICTLLSVLHIVHQKSGLVN